MVEEIKKIIIDTDPGIDDAIAIFVALQSPEIEVIGLTTIFGNVHTTLSTRNALHLLEIAGRTDIPVAEGPHVTVTAIQLDPEFFKKVGQIVVLGGAFAVNGNVSPAAEANIFKDPTAADIVFTSGADVLAVGLNITHQVVLTDSHRGELAKSNGKFAKYLSKLLDVYFDYHHTAYNTRGVFLHDPTALLAAVNPSLITYSEGVVHVQTVGITKGLTIFYNKQKRVVEVTEWSGKPAVKVAVTVDAPKVIELVMARSSILRSIHMLL
ncbi:probable uridine nucleosidase 2 isoform X3 [Solanum stenotomum]|uniref:probable uridine nucleosidase 2 isoform X3 n=1 Tax=Solanum stenotomum TaxID=172797 RepID=UPI0020D17A2B|nr:probable uridine nucleosidase 2 isoform X3 [Solanum stenotomum]